MAGDPSQSKTETATSRRREEARKQGQVALSQELNASIGLFVGITLLSWTAEGMMLRLMALIRQSMEFHRFSEWTAVETTQLTVYLLEVSGQVLGAFAFGIFLVALAANIGQIGFRIQTEVLQIKWDRLSPAKGYQKLFSMRSAVRGGWGILKLICIMWISIVVIRRNIPLLNSASSMELGPAIQTAWSVILSVGWSITGALLIVGIVDYIYQRWQHEEDLKMSRQDIKEEQKQDEGDPQIKSRLRKLQREAARMRMLQDVPTASVVLTNPTHYAVALKYERGVSKAPKVVAKGTGLLAKRIARIARENGITVLERKPLTRALYASVEVGQEIPDTLFRAVAEVLAYVYRLAA